MELYTLKINVTNQRLSFGENPPEIFSGDQSIDFVEFTFTDDTWNFPNIWAIFYRQKGAAYQIALDDNKVMIPAEVMQKRGYVYIGLMATDGENVQTSSVLQYSIRQGAANVETVTPSPSIYEQFLADLDAYQEAIHNLETLAATAETLPAGSDATASYDNGVLQLGIPRGDTGATGNGIQSITKTGTSGSVDTYTITFTDGSTTTYTVTNGEVTRAEFDSVIEPIETELDMIFETNPAPVLINNISGVEAKTGYNASDGSASIAMSTNASYDSYWFVASEDYDIYFDSNITASYFAVVVGGQYQSSAQIGNYFYIYCQNGSVRYRKSDGNLPTENNKLHITAGCPVAFTINAGLTLPVYGIATNTEVKDTFADEVLSKSSKLKNNYLKYVNGSGPDSSTEKVEIYLPAVNGYLRYDFLHTVNAGTNADTWRVGFLYHVDDNFVQDYQITTSGEWELAIKLDGRPDFSGGYAHGDEVMTDVLFIVDGTPVDITTFTSMTQFEDLAIIKSSNLYDPNDSTTVYAEHGSEHQFTSEGLIIQQSLKFILNETVNTAYMAMLPIAKAVSDYVVPDNSFVPLSTNSPIRIYDTESAVIYKTSGKVKAVFSVPKWEWVNTGGYSFMCLDNGSTEYNKCYFVNTLGNVSVTSGKLYKSETHYSFIAK